MVFSFIIPTVDHDCECTYMHYPCIAFLLFKEEISPSRTGTMFWHCNSLSKSDTVGSFTMSYIQVYRFMDTVTLTGGLGQTLFHFSHSKHVFFPPFQLLRFRVRFITQHPCNNKCTVSCWQNIKTSPIWCTVANFNKKKKGVFAEGAYVKNICSPTLYIKSF